MDERLDLFASNVQAAMQPPPTMHGSRTDFWRDRILNLWKFRGLDPDYQARCLRLYGHAYCRARRDERVARLSVREAA
jgi:hypothetical protein